MRPVKLILSTLLIVHCTSPSDPSPLYPGYFLSRVGDQFLPIPYGNDGSVLLAASLSFSPSMRPGESAGSSGIAHYTLLIQSGDQTVQHDTVDLDYTIQNAELHINLCPPLALCIATTELIGPVLDRTEELVLTHYVAGTPGDVYRFFPSLPD